MTFADKKNFLIYGAYGYTGELITRLAVERGYRPLLGGRDENKLKALADELKLPYLAFSLTNEELLDKALQEVGSVLHCAGPFSKTVKLMVFACLRNKVNYLDITGEIGVFEWIASKDTEAKQAGVVLLPGVGFDVVPSDCLATFLNNKLPNARQLELAFVGSNQMSRGTALTMIENMHKGGMVRQDGVLKEVPAAYRTRKINFPVGKRSAVTIPWGDVATAYYSTGIPSIMVYTALDGKGIALLKSSNYLGWLLKSGPVQNFLTNKVNNSVTGPSQKHRQNQKCYLWGEVTDNQGKAYTATLETPEAYQLTAHTALLAVQKLGEMAVEPGFKTPSLAFGPDFILEVEGVKRTNGEHK